MKENGQLFLHGGYRLAAGPITRQIVQWQFPALSRWERGRGESAPRRNLWSTVVVALLNN